MAMGMDEGREKRGKLEGGRDLSFFYCLVEKMRGEGCGVKVKAVSETVERKLLLAGWCLHSLGLGLLGDQGVYTRLLAFTVDV